MRSSERAADLSGDLDALEREAVSALAGELIAMGRPAEGDLEPVANGLADAIESIGPDRWRDERQLASLGHAIETAGAALRRAERLVETDG